ncbi:MAG: hypothetical protein EU542_05930 [Promethearchaeota archaeon]|nr:MAG: hypothetical protein EU542_05930 [Candidatus Lokiarchaeota archaeon]
MEDVEIERLYKIDKKRLSNYYNRIKNQSRDNNPIKIMTKFLVNQSIGSSHEEVHDTLKYFSQYLAEGKSLLDLGFEWIRAQKIRLEYKKYLIRAQYPNNDLCLAVDDCIYRFFYQYDRYIRKLFKKEIREHNISALYDIFFSPFDRKSLNIEDILNRHLHIIPTHYCGKYKIDTSIMTLREGLSNIIVKDYEDVLFSRKEEEKKSETIDFDQEKKAHEISIEFNGSNLERLIKTYCFRKVEIEPKALESAITNFLTSYFKFGTFYIHEEFKENLIRSLAEYINSGLTGDLKNSYTVDRLMQYITYEMKDFINIESDKKLDGSAWINDLKPILGKFIKILLITLFER